MNVVGSGAMLHGTVAMGTLFHRSSRPSNRRRASSIFAAGRTTSTTGSIGSPECSTSSPASSPRPAPPEDGTVASAPRDEPGIVRRGSTSPGRRCCTRRAGRRGRSARRAARRHDARRARLCQTIRGLRAAAYRLVQLIRGPAPQRVTTTSGPFGAIFRTIT
jgi:hypothetical protein